jgi:hypothetical protein
VRAFLAVAVLAVTIGIGGVLLLRGTDQGQPTSVTGSAGPSSASPASQAPSAKPSAVDPTEPLSQPATAKAGAPVDTEPLAPVSLDERVDFGNGLVAVVTSVERVDVEARQPGETAGPAAAVRLKLRNTSEEPVDLAALAVNAEDVDGVPLIPNFTEPTEALSGILDPGASRIGRYVFRHDGDIDDLTIHVHHDTTPHFIVIRT